jgi:hypothetical protein
MPKPVRPLILFALLSGCGERDRLTFPSNQPGGDDEGPVSTIDVPSIDSTLTEGDFFVLGGRVVDPNGVDTVYIDAAGTGQAFLPIVGEGEDTVSIGIPIPTVGLSGTTVVVRIRGVDLLGNQGLTVRRQLLIE